MNDASKIERVETDTDYMLMENLLKMEEKGNYDNTKMSTRIYLDH